MLLPKDVYLQMAGNNRKLVALILFFPVALSAFVYFFLLAFQFLYNKGSETDYYEAITPFNPTEVLYTLLPIIILICVLIILGSFFRGQNLILHMTGAELCPEDKEHLKIYHAVENVALAAGLPTPKVYLIKDKALNAFATGYSPKNASITLTTGLVESLTPLELEAVIAHEMGHILNRDIRLNLFIITGIGVIGLVGEMLIRGTSRGRSGSKGKEARIGLILLAVGLALYLFRYFVSPFIHMAISRTQEFQADATSAYLTRNPAALIDALTKISSFPTVMSLSSVTAFSTMCIFNPLEAAAHLLDTHPPIKDRIERLEQMM